MSLPPAHCPNKEENDVHSTVSLEEIDFKNREVFEVFHESSQDGGGESWVC